MDDDAERIHVRPEVDLLSLALLRAHVFGRAHDGARDGRARPAVFLRDAEVHEPRHASLVAHDVRRLQVAVDDPGVVDRLQALRDLDGQLVRLVGSEAPTGREQLLEVDPLDELHRDVQQAAVLAEVVDGPHVSMAHLARELDLRFETRGHRRVGGEVGPEDLDGDDLVQRAVSGEVHRSHAAEAELASDLVASGEERAGREVGGHHYSGALGEVGATLRAASGGSSVLGETRRAGHQHPWLRRA
jgi:hypothetical protein